MSKHWINVDILDEMFDSPGHPVQGWKMVEAYIQVRIADETGEEFEFRSTGIGFDPADDPASTWPISHVEDSGEEMVEVFPL